MAAALTCEWRRSVQIQGLEMCSVECVGRLQLGSFWLISFPEIQTAKMFYYIIIIIILLFIGILMPNYS